MGRTKGSPPESSGGAAGAGALGARVISAAEMARFARQNKLTGRTGPHDEFLWLAVTCAVVLFVYSVAARALVGVLFFLFAAVVLVVLALRRPGGRRSESAQDLVLHTGGLVHSTGGRTRTVLWEEVAEIQVLRTGGYEPRLYACQLTLRGGGRLGFSVQQLQGLDLVGGALEEKVAQAQLPAALASIEAGRSVRFGSLHLDATGLADGADRLPWAEVGLVGGESAAVVLADRSAGRLWRRQQANLFPNLALFRLLAERYLPEE
ncbi:DUF6585 family protein [Kitasatospora sp. NPDC057223]|uniref:DUF6585 family protein n=1 Tax=Kitasatospora sp. NPDC057223 TaxID=3346055 RepID=UPI0036275FA0